ncbi:MAG: CRISPR-associated helicase Cas3', partial [Thermoplasmata archaeon]
MLFDDFFIKATGCKPYQYQIGLATCKELPDIINIPTGAGKTAGIILAWVWRRCFNDETRDITPRRLVYCLPLRTLVEQTRDVCKKWLDNLGILTEKHDATTKDKIAVTVLMGGEDEDNWYLYPERNTIIIGTQDMLISGALNRGYGISRFKWPLYFGLLNTDCLWVMDEVQLMRNGLATSAQLQAFRQSNTLFKETKTIWMSATIDKDWLKTIDFKKYAPSLQILSINFSKIKGSVLAKRLKAKKSPPVKMKAKFNEPEKIARDISKIHKKGTMTLVVLNTVRRARDLYKALKKVYESKPVKKIKKRKNTGATDTSNPEIMLIHSHFRAEDRKKKMDLLKSADEIIHKKKAVIPNDDWQKSVANEGIIVVSTQVVEAGIDISAKTLITELSPWSSLVQRFGRCNRYGEYKGANMWWIDIPIKKSKNTLPYEETDLKNAKKNLEDKTIKNYSPGKICGSVSSNYTPTHVIRYADIKGLFSTEMDLAGGFTDVSNFVRDSGTDLNVYLFWRNFKGVPSKEEAAPLREEICPVLISEFEEFLGDKKVAWIWNYEKDDWEALNKKQIRPGMTLLLSQNMGGY